MFKVNLLTNAYILLMKELVAWYAIVNRNQLSTTCCFAQLTGEYWHIDIIPKTKYLT